MDRNTVRIVKAFLSRVPDFLKDYERYLQLPTVSPGSNTFGELFLHIRVPVCNRLVQASSLYEFMDLRFPLLIHVYDFLEE